MIKKFLKTVLIVVGIFFLIMLVMLPVKIITSNKCNEKNLECPEKFTCNIKQQKCVAVETCSEIKPEICINLYDPVCSNGKEYSNSCVACSNGVKNYYKGNC